MTFHSPANQLPDGESRLVSVELFDEEWAAIALTVMRAEEPENETHAQNLANAMVKIAQANLDALKAQSTALTIKRTQDKKGP